MKIALLSFEYPPETGYGGIGTYTWYQARALVKLGHSVDVLCGANETTALRSSEHDGVRVHRYRSDGSLMRSFARLDKMKLWWTKNRLENGLSMYRAFQVLNEENHYDLVELPECGAEGLLINKLTEATVVMKLHSPSRLIMPFYDVRPADIRFCSFLEQIGIDGAGAFSSCSGFLAQKAREQLGIRREIRVIPNGIDLELFDAQEKIDVRKKFEIPTDRLMILFSGRMEQRKGIHLCKEIVASILERFEVAFVFAGQDLFHYMSDELLPYWKSKDLKGSIHYLGRLDQISIRSCLRAADIFLIPSLWENCPYSCLEAMASGCAILSTNQGGMPELIRDGENGLLAQNEDRPSYIRCLERLIEDRTLREKLAGAARRTIEESFTDMQIAKLSEDYYLDCLHRRNGTRQETKQQIAKGRVEESIVAQ